MIAFNLPLLSQRLSVSTWTLRTSAACLMVNSFGNSSLFFRITQLNYTKIKKKMICLELMKNILRVKVDGNSIMKFCQSKNKQDFYCYFPPILQDKYALEVHFSFHSKTGRTTFKTTSLKSDQKEMLPNILNMVKNHPLYKNAVTNKDLDLYKGKKIIFDEKQTFYPWFQLALNMQNADVSRYFGQSKTSDAGFQSVFDIKIAPPRNEQVTIKGFIGKNIKTIPDKKDREYDLSLAVVESNFLNDKYSFIFCLSHDFPDIKRKD
jgi:hypothetical protein